MEDFLSSEPVKSSDLVLSDEADERALIASINSWLKSESFIEALKIHNQAIFPCAKLRPNQIYFLKKHFNEESGWNIFSVIMACNTCPSQNRGMFGAMIPTSHVCFRIVEKKKEEPKAKLTLGEKIIDFFFPRKGK